MYNQDPERCGSCGARLVDGKCPAREEAQQNAGGSRVRFDPVGGPLHVYCANCCAPMVDFVCPNADQPGHADMLHGFPFNPSPPVQSPVFSREEQILHCAMRYCIGRRTYIVSTCCEWIREAWPNASGYFRDLVVRELRVALDRETRDPGSLGMAMDAAEWDALYKWTEAYAVA